MTDKNLKRLERLSQLFVTYVGMMIRRQVTTKHVGADLTLDRQITALAVRRVYGLDSYDPADGTVDRRALGALSAKVPHTEEERIKKEISAFLLFKVARLQQLVGQPIAKEPTALQIAYQRTRLARKLRREQRFFSEANATKLTITYESILKALALIGPVLLLGGLIEQLVLSNDFGYNMSLVFSLGDYVAASVSTLIYSILPILLVIIAGYFTFHERSRLPPERRVRSKGDELRSWLGLIIIVSVAVYLRFTDLKSFYTVLPFAIMLASMMLLPLIFLRYFKGGLALFVLLFVLVTFFGNVYANTERYAIDVRTERDKYTYTFRDSAVVRDQPALRLVISGSNYMVFYDQTHGTTLLVRSDELVGAKQTGAP